MSALDRQELLTQALRQGYSELRIGAIKVVSVLKDPSYTDDLIELLKDPFYSVRSEAIVALASIGGEKARKAIKSLVSDKDDGIRADVIAALARFENRDDLPLFIQLAQDKDKKGNIRYIAVHALKPFANDPATSSLLQKLLEDPNGSVKTMARQVLDATDQNRKNLAERFKNIWKKQGYREEVIDTFIAHHSEFIFQFFQEGNERDIALFVIPLIADSDLETRRIAISVGGYLGNTALMEPLLKQLNVETEGDLRHQIIVILGLLGKRQSEIDQQVSVML